MIDRESEQLLTLPQAAATLPGRKAGKSIGTSTIWRWARNGCLGIRLETIMIGMTMYTSQDAIDRFFAAVQAKKNGEDRPDSPIPRATPKRRRREIDEASRELRKKLGLPLS